MLLTVQVERCKAAAVAKQLKASAASARNTPQQQSQRGRQQQQQQQQQADAAAAANGDGPGKTPGYNVAYVGNIAFEARPEDISALFEACNVTKVCVRPGQQSVRLQSPHSVCGVPHWERERLTAGTAAAAAYQVMYVAVVYVLRGCSWTAVRSASLQQQRYLLHGSV